MLLRKFFILMFYTLHQSVSVNLVYLPCGSFSILRLFDMTESFLSMRTGSPTSEVVLEATNVAPTTLIETDDSGRRTETTTLHKIFQIPQYDDSETGRAIIEEYERCLGRNEDTFADLFRVYNKQKNSETKLKLQLEEAKKKEANEKRKNEALKEAVDSLAKGLPKIVKQSDDQMDDEKIGEDNEEIPDTVAIKRMITEAERKIEDLRRQKKELDKKHADLNAKLGDAEEKIQRKNIDDDIAKLAHEIDETKGNIIKLLHAINEALQQVGKRLDKEYVLTEDPDSTKDVRRVLDTFLIDVKYLLDESEKLQDESDGLQNQINELERRLKEAKSLNKQISNQMRQLSTIDSRNAPEPKNSSEMIKFVDERFEQMVNALNKQNIQMAEAKEKLKDEEQDDERDRIEFEQEKAVKLAQAEGLKHYIEELKAKNQTLQDKLNRSPPKTPVAEEPEVENSIQKLVENFEVTDRNLIEMLENKLKQIKEKNEMARNKLEGIVPEINNIEAKLKQKQEELKHLRDKAESHHADGNEENSKVQKRISDLEKEIEQLERKLAELMYRSGNPQEYYDSLANTSNFEQILIEKIKNLDRQLMGTQSDKAQMNEILKQLEKQLRDVNNSFMQQETRENQLEDKLDDIKGKINNTEKALNRQSRKKFQMEREMRQTQPVELLQTVTTRIVGADGGAQVTQNEQKFIGTEN